LRRLEAGRVVGLFPEGGLSNASRIKLRRGKCGAAWLALKSRVPVYAAYIGGGPQSSNIRWAWFCHSRVHVNVGKPLELSRFFGRPVERRLLEEVTRYFIQEIENLKYDGRNRLCSQTAKCPDL
jgi:1-acyl-sn-glycerol-3-phosphate acyltransferase